MDHHLEEKKQLGQTKIERKPIKNQKSKKSQPIGCATKKNEEACIFGVCEK